MSRNVIGLILLAALLSTCAKTENTVLTPNPNAVGTITGWVKVYEGKLQRPGEGVAVTVDGTSYSAICDAYGKWTIENIPSGTYNLTFSKTGYGPSRTFGLQYIGGVFYFGVTYLGHVSEAPVRTISARSLDSMNSGLKYDSTQQRYDTVKVLNERIEIDLGFDGPIGDKLVQAYIGLDSLVSSAPGHHIAALRARGSVPPQDDAYTMVVTRSDELEYFDISRGTRIYIVVCTAVRNPTQYYDPEYNENVITGLSTPSKVVSVITP